MAHHLAFILMVLNLKSIYPYQRHVIFLINLDDFPKSYFWYSKKHRWRNGPNLGFLSSDGFLAAQGYCSLSIDRNKIMLIGGRIPGIGSKPELKAGILDFSKSKKPEWTLLYSKIPFKNSYKCSSELIFKKNGKRLVSLFKN